MHPDLAEHALCQHLSHHDQGLTLIADLVPFGTLQVELSAVKNPISDGFELGG